MKPFSYSWMYHSPGGQLLDYGGCKNVYQLCLAICQKEEDLLKDSILTQVIPDIRRNEKLVVGPGMTLHSSPFKT